VTDYSKWPNLFFADDSQSPNWITLRKLAMLDAKRKPHSLGGEFLLHFYSLRNLRNGIPDFAGVFIDPKERRRHGCSLFPILIQFAKVEVADRILEAVHCIRLGCVPSDSSTILRQNWLPPISTRRDRSRRLCRIRKPFLCWDKSAEATAESAPPAESNRLCGSSCC
jgi:hypothetical protein